MRPAIFAAGAALALLCLDAYLLTVAFLYGPAGFWIAAAACIAIFAAALFLKRPWLAFVAQNVVSAILLYRLVQYAALPVETRGTGFTTNLLVPVAAIVVGNLLTWVVTRALPVRSVRGN